MDKWKCYNCSKIFKYDSQLQRHINRKTPCLIRDLSDNDKQKIHCIYCNKVYKTNQSLNKHIEKCKIKNGGMHILEEKLEYETMFKELKNQIVEDRAHIKKLEETVIELTSAPITINTSNSITTSNTINNQNNIILASIGNPDLSGLKITLEDVRSTTNLTSKILEKIYFNPEFTQNYLLYVTNIKDKKVLVYDDPDTGWELKIGDEIDKYLIKMLDTVQVQGAATLNGRDGPYAGDDISFNQLPPAVQRIIRDFNGFIEKFTHKDVYNLAVSKKMIQTDYIKKLKLI